MLQAPTEGYEDAIVIPEINANFELKHGLINLVQNKQFFGHDKEDPHAHIRYFNKITSTMRFPDIPSTSIKLMLFPFSLEGSARIWLEKEPPRSILTWDDLISFTMLLNANDQDSLNSAAGGKLFVVAKVSSNSSTPGISPDVAALTTEVSELKNLMKTMLIDKQKALSSRTVKAVRASCVNLWSKKLQQGQVYQPPTIQTPVYQAPSPAPQMQGVSKTDFENYVKANDAVLSNMQNQGQGLQNQNVNAIITRSGKNCEGPSTAHFPTPIVSTPLKEPEQNPETSMDKVQKPSSESIALVPPPEDHDSIFIKIPKLKAKETVQEPISPDPNLYQPKLPYPERMKVREKDTPSAQQSRFMKLFKQLRLEIGLRDALIEMPKFNKWLSALLRNKEKLEEIAITTVNKDPRLIKVCCILPAHNRCCSLLKGRGLQLHKYLNN
ncbi:hypothetical protein Tco_0169371 [Tanacetum coccineum]